MQYEIKGGAFPVAVCSLAQGEKVICEAGAMSWMDDGIEMATKSGGLGKMAGRLFSGEDLFQNEYEAKKAGQIAFAASFPGEIRPVEIAPGKSIIAQKGSFLASEPTVNMDIYFQKKIGSGFFGGEGFIMQKFSGSGTVFVEIDGGAEEFYLEAGQKMVIDTGYLVMMDETCSIDVVMLKGVGNMLFGGEGLFNTVVTGPGKIVVQTIPASQMAAVLGKFFTKSN